MKEYQINIFVRVVKRKMAVEGKTADEILSTYPALTDKDKQTIKARF